MMVLYLLLLAPWHAWAKASDAKDLLTQGKYRQAEQAILKAGPSLPVDYWRLARIYAADGRIEQAQAALDKAYELDPSIGFLAEPERFTALRGQVGLAVALAQIPPRQPSDLLPMTLPAPLPQATPAALSGVPSSTPAPDRAPTVGASPNDRSAMPETHDLAERIQRWFTDMDLSRMPDLALGVLIGLVLAYGLRLLSVWRRFTHLKVAPAAMDRAVRRRTSLRLAA
jgi:tetratricopeptide (TPR) repeat protein